MLSIHQPAPVLMRQGVIWQLRCDAIDPWPLGEPLMQQVNALHGSRSMRSSGGALGRGPLSLQASAADRSASGGIRISPGASPRGCLGWHDLGVIDVNAERAWQPLSAKEAPEVLLHRRGLFLSDLSAGLESDVHQLVLLRLACQGLSF